MEKEDKQNNPIAPFSEDPQTEEEFAALMEEMPCPALKPTQYIRTDGKIKHTSGRAGINQVEKDYRGT